jgi:hypothetical protein
MVFQMKTLKLPHMLRKQFNLKRSRIPKPGYLMELTYSRMVTPEIGRANPGKDSMVDGEL